MNIQRLNDIIEPSVTSLGFKFIGCEYIPQGRRVLLRVYIDKSGGVNLDDCAAASRQVSAVLDVEDPIEGFYNLEVSSPGRKRRLFTLEQCQHFVGEVIAIKLKMAQDGRRNFVGELKQVEGETIVLFAEETAMTFVFSDIEKAHLNPIDD